MNVRAMRAIDRAAGIPLCWLSGAWLRVHGAMRRAAEPGLWRSVLVIKMFGMGSVLLTGHLLHTLHTRMPHARLIYLSFDGNAELLSRLEIIDERITIRTGSLFQFGHDTVRAIARIRRLRPEVVFDLEFFSKFSTFLSVLSGAGRRFGYALPTLWRTLNVTDPVQLRHDVHVSEVFLDQARAAGIHPAGSRGAITLTASDNERATLNRKVPVLAAHSGAVAVININAGPTFLERRWAPSHFLQVARQWSLEHRDALIIFTGDREEKHYVASAIADGSLPAGKAINAAGGLTLGEFIALMQRADWFLTNDTGPMHVGAAAGVPIVALFGPESPAFYGPGGGARVLYAGISCSPCLNVYNAKTFKCPYNARCMDAILPADVSAALRGLAAPQIPKVAGQ